MIGEFITNHPIAAVVVAGIIGGLLSSGAAYSLILVLDRLGRS